VVGCVVIATAVAAAYVKLAPRRYSAQAQMLISPISSTDTTLFSLPVLHSSSDPTRDVLTAASLITTPQVADAVVRDLQLRESPGALLASVQATPLNQSNLVSISADASSASQAQAIANDFANEVISTRSAALHAAVAVMLPGIRTQVAALPPAERSGPGTLGDELSQLEQLQTSKDPTITLAAPASLPTGPYTPQTKLSLAAGLFGGLILGIGAAFGFHALDPRLRREEQLRELFDLPILARIPRERMRRRDRPMLPREMSFAAHEGYRTLRTMLTSRAAGEPRAYLVTGSSPAEGKTTSAVSLAASLAQGGARVVLIEADLRRPTIASTLGLELDYGTEHVVTGEVELAEALTVVKFEGVPVRVLAVHKAGMQLADRLSFAAAQRLIREAMELADFVVIDSPPLTAVIDALPLAQLADEVLIVARLGSSKLSKLSELHELLMEQGSYASGLVLIGESPMRRVPYYYSDEESQGLRARRGGEARRREPVRQVRE